MLSALNYQWQVWQLNRQRDHLERAYRPDRAAAKKKGVAALMKIMEEEYFEARPIADELAQLETRYLLRQAARQRVPIPDPDDEDAWIESDIIGGHHLSRAAYAELRAAIRKERNEKWDFRLKVVGLLITGLIGTVGALIGLVSALKK